MRIRQAGAGWEVWLRMQQRAKAWSGSIVHQGLQLASRLNEI